MGIFQLFSRWKTKLKDLIFRRVSNHVDYTYASTNSSRFNKFLVDALFSSTPFVCEGKEKKNVTRQPT